MQNVAEVVWYLRKPQETCDAVSRCSDEVLGTMNLALERTTTGTVLHARTRSRPRMQLDVVSEG